MILNDTHLAHYLGIRQSKSPALPSDSYASVGMSPAIDELTQLQPASIDLRLGPNVTRFERSFGTVDAAEGLSHKDLRQQRCVESLDIAPGEFLLAHTLEYIELPDNLTGRVEGRSSIGRLGVAVHITAGFIDPGFSGQITLEIVNLSRRPVRIPIGHRCCQLVLETMTGPAARPYGSKELGSRFQHQTGAQPFERA